MHHSKKSPKGSPKISPKNSPLISPKNSPLISPRTPHSPTNAKGSFDDGDVTKTSIIKNSSTPQWNEDFYL